MPGGPVLMVDRLEADGDVTIGAGFVENPGKDFFFLGWRWLVKGKTSVLSKAR